MKRMYKTALLAALGLASVTAAKSATYNGDLLVGFTTGSGSDVIYDLGSASSLTNGQTWDLSSVLTGYTLSGVEWGVIGSTGPVSGGSGLNNQRYVYTTDLTDPQNLTGKNMWNGINGTAVPGIYQNFTTTGAGASLSIASTDISGNSWYGSTTISGGSGNSSGFFTAYADPNTTGLGSVNFYQAVATDTAPTQFGTFSLDGTSTLTFAAVPEPSTFGLFAAGGGLLLLTWRNKFRSNKA